MPTLNNIQPGQTVTLQDNFPQLTSGENCCPIEWTAVCGDETLNGTGTVCVNVAPVTGEALPQITCNTSRLAQAQPYADLFWQYFPDLKADVEVFGLNKTDLQHFQDSSFQYGGRTGIRMYQFKDWIESITRMMLLEHSVGNSARAQTYKDCLQEILDDMVPKFISGDGTAIANSSNASAPWSCGSEYRPCRDRNPAVIRHRFLDATRALTWMGYAMCSMQKCGTTAAQDAQFVSWAQALQPAVARFVNNSSHCATSNGGFSHMCLHPLVGACYMGKIGGYLGTYSSQIGASMTMVVNNILGSTPSGDLGSDLGHDTASISNLYIMRDKQLDGEGLGPPLTKNSLRIIADRTAARISSGSTWGNTAQAATGNAGWIHMHALGVANSGAIRNLVDAATLSNYPNIPGGNIHTGSNQMVTLASAAYGYACRDDGEIC